MDGKVEEDPMTKALDLAVCMAHPDDECLVAGALMAQSVHEGLRVGVFLATAGECRSSSVIEWTALGDERLSLRARPLWTFSMFPLFSPRLPDGDSYEPSGDALELRLITWLTEMRPKCVVTYGLDGGYGHVDHLAVTNTLLN